MKFIIFQLMIFGPFVAGMIVRARRADSAAFSKRLLRFNLMTAEPLIVLWSIWGLSLTREFVFLPFLGLALVGAGMACGRLLAVPLGLRGRTRATYLITSALANQGYPMGGFLCYLLMGEEGLGISFIFIAYFMFCVFLIMFPYAQKVSTGSGYNLKFLRELLMNRQNMPMYAIVAALLLQALHIGRPQVFFPFDALLLFSIGISYLSLGLTFQIGGLLASWRENLGLAATKFMIVPLLALAAVEAMHLEGALRAVVLLESFMPAAVYSVITSVLFDLDAPKASSLFVFNTLVFLAIVLPLLFCFKTPLLGL